MPDVTAEPVAVEYLYGTLSYFSDDNEYVRDVIPFRITKRTPKRVFYATDQKPWERRASVDRKNLEEHGVVRNRSRHWSAVDYELYATREAALASITPEPVRVPTVQELRREMADAHPDRGGTAEAFRAARARYEAAKRRAAPSPTTPEA